LRIAAGNNSAAVLKLKEAMVEDLYIFFDKSANNVTQPIHAPTQPRRASARHFRTASNIGLSARNATPGRTDSGSTCRGSLNAINIVFSMG